MVDGHHGPSGRVVLQHAEEDFVTPNETVAFSLHPTGLRTAQADILECECVTFTVVILSMTRKWTYNDH